MPILEGLDGIQKMSKSLNNYIGIIESPKEMFGKVMSISDNLMLRYYELLTLEPLEAIKDMHPMEAKKKLGKIIVARFHSASAADEAQAEFEKVFSKGNNPEEITKQSFKEKTMPILNILVETKLSSSMGEAKRLIKQGGVRVDGQVVTDEKLIVDLTTEKIINVGKRNFVRTVYRL
jgi:tyrosyl-tRNA synthetase